MIPPRTRGLLLGKFLPPHRGHQLLVDFARRFADDLAVLVCTLEREPIAGDLRYRWMREMFPACQVIHLTDDLPQEPSEHPDFWNLWRHAIRALVPAPLDYVFASEPYGTKLAEVLGARFIPVDPDRAQIPASGTLVRGAPLEHWHLLPEVVRAHFVKRVCIFGPESTGKSTLAKQLAHRYGTAHVAEFARTLLDLNNGRCEAGDIALIVKGQAAMEDALAAQAHRVLFCDTDVLTTTLWSRELFGDCPAWIEREANARRYDLTLLLDVDVPWVDDGQRFFSRAEERARWFALCESALQRHGRVYRRISGNWEERLAAACAAVDAILR